MDWRSSKSIVTFTHPFALAVGEPELPPGDYEVVAEEELLQGLSFEAYRRVATFLTVRNRGGRAGLTEMRPVTETQLEAAISRDRTLAGVPDESDAAPPPRKDHT